MNNKILPFSIRFRNALTEGKISVVISKIARADIFEVLMEFNFEFKSYPNRNRPTYDVITNSSEETCEQLKRVYRIREPHDDSPTASTMSKEGENFAEIELKYIENCLGEKVFDVIQVWCTTMNESQYKFEFQKKINLIFEQEKTGWIFTDQHFYKLDSGFMETFVLTQTTDLLNECKYTGPLEEFQKARDFLEEGRNKEAIDHAYMAFESVLKAVTGNSDGQFNELIGQLPKGYFTGLPAGVNEIFRKKVFGALPPLRNKLGGHGQGELSFIVSREFAELAVHLSGTLIIFLIKRQAAMAPEIEEVVEQPSISHGEDDIPF